MRCRDHRPPLRSVRPRRWTASLVFLIASSLVRPALPAIFVVDNNAFDLGDVVKGDGICAFFGTAPGACTLRAAIQEANALAGTDLILLPAGTYVLSLVGNDDTAAFGDLDITGPLGILGAGPGETIVDAAGIDRIFDIKTNVSVTISGLTLIGGSTPETGGAIRVVPQGAILTLHDCRLNNNDANAGGAILNYGTTTIEGCDFFFNRALTGTSTNPDGGAILSRGTLEVTASSFSSNIADGLGGAIFLENADSASIVASTISSNDPQGIRSQNTPLTLVSNTIAFNADNGLRATSCCNQSVSLACNIIADNQGAECSLISVFLSSNGENIFEDTTCGIGFTDLVADPLLGPLTTPGGHVFGHLPFPGSPAIDGGSAICSAIDSWGVTRPVDGNGDGLAVADVGAIEVVPFGWIFGDGFESASTGAWSSSSP